MEIIGTQNEIIKSILDKLEKDVMYDVIIKKHKNKRSLNANAYCWVLLEKMAKVLHTNKTDLYIKMLKDYGQFEYIIVKKSKVDMIKARIDEQREDERYRAMVDLGKVTVESERGETEGEQLQMYIGSSNYDTKEMARFIDGIVNECKDLNIETMTPAELDLLKKEWRY